MSLNQQLFDVNLLSKKKKKKLVVPITIIINPKFYCLQEIDTGCCF